MNSRQNLIDISLIIAVLTVSLIAQPAMAQNPIADLDSYVLSVLQGWEAPGIAVAVVKDDQVVYAKGFGVREVGGSDPVDEHTIFAIASTSKAFTAAALGMLTNRGGITDPGIQRPFKIHDVCCTDIVSNPFIKYSDQKITVCFGFNTPFRHSITFFFCQ